MYDIQETADTQNEEEDEVQAAEGDNIDEFENDTNNPEH